MKLFEGGRLSASVRVLVIEPREPDPVAFDREHVVMLTDWTDERPERVFKKLVDPVVVAAMGPPGGGRNAVSSRLLRHFNLLCFTDFNEDTMKHIKKSGSTMRLRA